MQRGQGRSAARPRIIKRNKLTRDNATMTTRSATRSFLGQKTSPCQPTVDSARINSNLALLDHFTLLEQRSPVTFLVDLPPSYNIHNIFHVDLFRHYRESPLAFVRRTPAPTPPVVIEGNEEYEVECILRYRKYRRQHQFLVSWKGYGREDQN